MPILKMKIERIGKNDNHGYWWLVTTGRGRNFKHLAQFRTEAEATAYVAYVAASQGAPKTDLAATY